MATTHYPGLAGIGTERTATPRKVFVSQAGVIKLPSNKVIDGSVSRDPLNTGDLDVLRAGVMLGKITSGGKYAPAVLGVLAAAYDASADTTSMTVSAATAVELNRRVGSSGTFKLTGPPAASGVVQTVTVTYSAVDTSTGVITITALSVDTDEVQTITPSVGANADEVHTITFDAAMTGGVLDITYFAPDGTPIPVAVAWDTDWATTLAAWNVASTAAATVWAGEASVGAVLSGTATVPVLTFSGVGFTNNPIETPSEAVLGGTTGPTNATTVITTAGSGTICRGTYRLGIVDASGDMQWTADIAHDANAAAINTALDDALAASAVVATGGPMSGPTAVVLTFSGTGFAAVAQGLVEVDISGLVGCDDVSVVETTAAVVASGAGSNDFVVGSLVQPTDGSETILTFVPDGYGIKVTDQDAANIDVPLAEIPLAGLVDASQLVNYPSDASLKAHVKAALRAVGVGFAFDDDF